MTPDKHPASPLQTLPNIGPELASQLHRAGIGSVDQLYELGTEQAFIRLKTIFPDACIHRLQAVAGAIRGIRKHQLLPERKAQLTALLRQLSTNRKNDCKQYQ